MHGIIFASFRDYVADTLGRDAAMDVFANGYQFSVGESYPDEQLIELVQRASDRSAQPVDELVRGFGVFTASRTFPRLYPAFYTVAGSTRPFLLTIEDRIHELVRATIPNARPPQLHVTPTDGGVRIVYTSERRLCTLLCGLVEGTALHFGEQAQLDEVECARHGAPSCVFEVALPGRG